MIKCLDVALLIPPFKTYTYTIPSYLKDFKFDIGMRVIVPLRSRYCPGIVMGYYHQKKSERDLKPILMPLEKFPLFDEKHIKVFKDLSTHLVLEVGQLIEHVLPSHLKSLKIYFKDTKKYPIIDLAKKGSPKFFDLLKKWEKGEVEIVSNSREEITVELKSPPPWPLRKNAFSMLKVLEYLYVHGPTSKEELIFQFGSKVGQVINSLVKKDLIVLKKREDLAKELKTEKKLTFIPTEEQQQVINSVITYIEQGKFHVALLHGITGSGKTYVYVKLMKRVLELNKNCILLIPEASLAETIYNEIKEFFLDTPIYLYHGYLTSKYRAHIFKQIARENTPFIVVGTRSSIFLPVKNTGIIIVDEEHDTSYKQDDRIRYHVRDVTYLISSMYNSTLLFGSATPDIKTYYAATQNKIQLLKMEKRIGDRTLPLINLINLNEEPPKQGPFSERVVKEIKKTLKKGEQVIILLNRRGFSPIIFCTSCRDAIKCENCSVSMTYHKKIERLVCHYCGHSIPFPCTCPTCGSSSYVPLDVGTEQVEEFVTEHFGDSSLILRLDRDTYRKEKKHEDVLRSFAMGKYQMLVGTQMCSKGYNFPGVTLVVVVNGDIGLNLPDYRATERTFQLLIQVAGRSGRGDRPGKVFIQTRNPNHYCWQYIKDSDYHGFFKHEISRRKSMGYPPFSKLALIRFHIPIDGKKGDEIIKYIYQDIKNIKRQGLTILGPAPAPIFVINKKKRYQCLLKAEKWMPIREIASRIFNTYSKYNKHLKITLDMDPYHML